MATAVKVVGHVAVVKVSGVERYLYAGAIVPQGVTDGDIERLTSLGLLAEIEVPDEVELVEEEAATGEPPQADVVDPGPGIEPAPVDETAPKGGRGRSQAKA